MFSLQASMVAKSIRVIVFRLMCKIVRLEKVEGTNEYIQFQFMIDDESSKN
jgi:hypothetical protein